MTVIASIQFKQIYLSINTIMPGHQHLTPVSFQHEIFLPCLCEVTYLCEVHSDNCFVILPSHVTMSRIPVKNFSSSFSGFVSSYLKKQTPPFALAYPKLKLIALACPMCRIPFGSGGNRVRTWS